MFQNDLRQKRGNYDWAEVRPRQKTDVPDGTFANKPVYGKIECGFGVKILWA
jgi:hypothetical protein